MIIRGRDAIANVFGVSVKTIHEWHEQGLPIAARGSPGKPSEYDTLACINWLVDREVGKVIRERPQDRLARVQADKIEMENAERRRVLIPAIDRVNNVQALNYTLELKETKSWKRVSKLQFKFIPKVQPSLGLPMTWPPEIIEVLGKIGYSEDDIRDLSQAYSLEEVAEGLNKLQSADTRLKAQGERVGAPRAYLEGILRNLRQGEEADKIEHEKLMAEVRAHEARAAAEDRLAKLKNLFQEHQRNRFADWFNALPAENRDQLVADFISSPDTGPGIRMMLKKGVKESDYGNQALLRTWMSGARPDLLDYALPNPEDKEFEAWMAWRLAGGDVMFFQ